MTTKSGPCLDEILARDLGYPESARKFHKQCRSPEQCGCPGHRDGEDEQ